MSSSSQDVSETPSPQSSRVGPGSGPARAGRRWTRRVLLVLIGALFVASVPWYRPASGGDPPGMLLGLPDWVAVALACYVAAAFLNAGAWLLTDLRDAPKDWEHPSPGDGRDQAQ